MRKTMRAGGAAVLGAILLAGCASRATGTPDPVADRALTLRADLATPLPVDAYTTVRLWSSQRGADRISVIGTYDDAELIQYTRVTHEELITPQHLEVWSPACT